MNDIIAYLSTSESRNVLRGIIDITDDSKQQTINTDDLCKNFNYFKSRGVTFEDKDEKEIVQWVSAYFEAHGTCPHIDILTDHAASKGSEKILALLKDIINEKAYTAHAYEHACKLQEHQILQAELKDFIQRAYGSYMPDPASPHYERKVQQWHDGMVKGLNQIFSRKSFNEKIPNGVEIVLDNKLKNRKLVHGLFDSQTLIVIGSAPGGGKTSVVTDMIRTIHEGLPVFNIFQPATDHAKHRFLYINMDRAYHEFFTKSLIPAKLNGVDYIDILHKGIKLDFSLTDSASQKMLELHVINNKIDYVIIDTLSTCSCIEEGKSDPRLNEVLNFLRDLSIKLDICVIVMHHPRKQPNNARDKHKLNMDDLAGGAYLSRVASECFMLNLIDVDDPDSPREIIACKNNVKMPRLMIKLFYEMQTNSDAIDIDSVSYVQLRYEENKEKVFADENAIINALYSGKNTVEDIVKHTNISAATTYRRLKILLSQKKVKKSKSHYFPIDAVADFIEDLTPTTTVLINPVVNISTDSTTTSNITCQSNYYIQADSSVIKKYLPGLDSSAIATYRDRLSRGEPLIISDGSNINPSSDIVPLDIGVVFQNMGYLA